MKYAFNLTQLWACAFCMAMILHWGPLRADANELVIPIYAESPAAFPELGTGWSLLRPLDRPVLSSAVTFKRQRTVEAEVVRVWVETGEEFLESSATGKSEANVLTGLFQVSHVQAEKLASQRNFVVGVVEKLSHSLVGKGGSFVKGSKFPNNNQQVDEWKSRFGDRYIASIDMGGRCLILMETSSRVSTRDATEAVGLKTELLSITNQQTASASSRTKLGQLHFWSVGGTSGIQVLEAPDRISFAGLHSWVASINRKTAVPVSCMLSPYAAVDDDFPPISTSIERATLIENGDTQVLSQRLEAGVLEGYTGKAIDFDCRPGKYRIDVSIGSAGGKISPDRFGSGYRADKNIESIVALCISGRDPILVRLPETFDPVSLAIDIPRQPRDRSASGRVVTVRLLYCVTIQEVYKAGSGNIGKKVVWANLRDVEVNPATGALSARIDHPYKPQERAVAKLRLSPAE